MWQRGCFPLPPVHGVHPSLEPGGGGLCQSGREWDPEAHTE